MPFYSFFLFFQVFFEKIEENIRLFLSEERIEFLKCNIGIERENSENNERKR
jgi:hypothetical protein